MKQFSLKGVDARYIWPFKVAEIEGLVPRSSVLRGTDLYLLQYSRSADHEVTPVLKNGTSGQVLHGDIPDRLVLVPCSADYLMAQLDETVQFILLRDAPEVFKNF